MSKQIKRYYSPAPTIPGTSFYTQSLMNMKFDEIKSFRPGVKANSNYRGICISDLELFNQEFIPAIRMFFLIKGYGDIDETFLERDGLWILHGGSTLRLPSDSRQSKIILKTSNGFMHRSMALHCLLNLVFQEQFDFEERAIDFMSLAFYREAKNIIPHLPTLKRIQGQIYDYSSYPP